MFLSPRLAVTLGTSDPKSRLKDISREVAQKAVEVRGMHPSRRDQDKMERRRQDAHYRGVELHTGTLSHTHIHTHRFTCTHT